MHACMQSKIFCGAQCQVDIGSAPTEVERRCPHGDVSRHYSELTVSLPDWLLLLLSLPFPGSPSDLFPRFPSGLPLSSALPLPSGLSPLPPGPKSSLALATEVTLPSSSNVTVRRVPSVMSERLISLRTDSSSIVMVTVLLSYFYLHSFCQYPFCQMNCCCHWYH